MFQKPNYRIIPKYSETSEQRTPAGLTKFAHYSEESSIGR